MVERARGNQEGEERGSRVRQQEDFLWQGESRGCEVVWRVDALIPVVLIREMCCSQFLLLFCWTPNAFVLLMRS